MFTGTISRLTGNIPRWLLGLSVPVLIASSLVTRKYFAKLRSCLLYLAQAHRRVRKPSIHMTSTGLLTNFP